MNNTQTNKQIQKLDNNSIIDLCANQVIVDLAGCVKELIENSIDAKSTLIDIFLIDNGKTQIQVKDNGIGISEENLQIIAQKGATSKLKDFDDLVNVSSFGFRGEALNSISNVSDMTIITKTQEQETGTKVQFQGFGKEPIKEPQAAQQGTIVTITKLFHKIPVRRIEFERNIKVQYNKLVNYVLEYSIINTNLKICLYNSDNKGVKQLISNSGNDSTIPKKIRNLLGQKYFEDAHEINIDLSDIVNKKISNDNNISSGINGVISKKIESGSGNETKWMKKNLLFLYLNNRPIDPLKSLVKLMNEIYKQYNNAGKYFFVLNFNLPNEILDFNLSPDKREVQIELEKELMSEIKQQIREIHEQLGSISKILDEQNNIKQNGGGAKKKKALFSQQLHDSTNDIENQKTLNIQPSKLLQSKKPGLFMKTLNSKFNQSKLNVNITKKENLPEKKQMNIENSEKQEDNFEKKEENIENLQENIEKQKQNHDNDSDSFQRGSNKQTDTETLKIQSKSNDLEISQFQSQLTIEDKQSEIIQNKNSTNIFQKNQEQFQNNKEKNQEQQSQEEEIDMNEKNQQENKKKTVFSFAEQREVTDDEEDVYDSQENNQKNKKIIQLQLTNNIIKDNQKKVMQQQFKLKFRQNLQETLNKKSIPKFFQNQKKEIENQSIKQQEKIQNNTMQIENNENNNITNDNNNGSETKTSNNINKIEKFQINNNKKDENNQLIDDQENSQSIMQEEEENEEEFKENKNQNIELQQEKEQEKQTTQNDLQESDSESNIITNVAFNKQNFTKLKVLGQFNKGFIITVFEENQEIFVIDQHASDEKKNYEKMMFDTKFQSQMLVKPLLLQFSQHEVSLVEENIEIFEKNGFKFDIIESEFEQITDNNLQVPQQPSFLGGLSAENSNCSAYSIKKQKEILIKQMPSCKGTQFGVEDFAEILNSVSNNELDSYNFRPKKIKTFLATKACRMSRMIGDNLNMQEMLDILDNLSTLKSPWNCPHGRPTMIKTPPLQNLINKIPNNIEEFPDF